MNETEMGNLLSQWYLVIKLAYVINWYTIL